MARTSKLTKPILVLSIIVNNSQDRVPGVVNIIEVPPQIAMLRNGLVIGIVTLETNTVDYHTKIVVKAEVEG